MFGSAASRSGLVNLMPSAQPPPSSALRQPSASTLVNRPALCLHFLPLCAWKSTFGVRESRHLRQSSASLRSPPALSFLAHHLNSFSSFLSSCQENAVQSNIENLNLRARLRGGLRQTLRPDLRPDLRRASTLTYARSSTLTSAPPLAFVVQRKVSFTEVLGEVLAEGSCGGSCGTSANLGSTLGSHSFESVLIVNTKNLAKPPPRPPSHFMFYALVQKMYLGIANNNETLKQLPSTIQPRPIVWRRSPQHLRPLTVYERKYRLVLAKQSSVKAAAYTFVSAFPKYLI
ncbi:hypothetical protein R3P38DRAFT_3344854 [Favolaschia claudopus]|uniref:Uncharacterized protein n=1 Tax=Favolaschia claudopus TaxID=2862362 RepID=A0AAW0DHF9_9AGAR